MKYTLDRVKKHLKKEYRDMINWDMGIDEDDGLHFLYLKDEWEVFGCGTITFYTLRELDTEISLAKLVKEE